ncbi:MFS transporter [Nocardiopsis halophila]|uniref:MFS transporter n=1 Tax=Nocardiopsis halophila TaxID=141692 RepID=UPI00034DC990|nr:MFS transporter [Nocardiopsis halophila]
MPDTATTTRPRRTAAALACLALVSFAIGTDDFMIAGVLPSVAAGLSVGEAAAGQLVTAFSLTYALAAPVLAVALARVPRRALLIGGTTAFAAVNLVSAFAPSYPVLMALRVATALLAAAVSPALFAAAPRLAAPGRAGRAVAAVAAGLTVSLFLGVPVGTLIASAFGWRATFTAVGLACALIAASCAALLPPLPAQAAERPAGRVRSLARPAVLTGVLGTVAGACSGFATYTYLAPLAREAAGADGPLLAGMVAVVGIAGAAGTFLGGRSVDRWGPDRALLSAFAGMVAAAAGLAVLAAAGPGPAWATGAVLAVWGAAAWGFNPAMNTRILALAGTSGTEALALNTSGLYAGIAAAGAVGGAALSGYGGAGPAAASAAVGAAALVLMAVAVRLYPAPLSEGSPPG